MRKLELLAPAGNAEIAMQAILHGADAVYMGASSHGARKNASNSIDDIRRVVDFAHIYRAKVYVTVNTIVYENELRKVERLIADLYRAGADAIIVQDMAILRLDIPPIELHASTQCDIRTPEKAKFLQDVGFSQLVLPRELTLMEISEIVKSVEIPVECFVHGALCVSYSGRCHASQAVCGRSANRGECAQICRLPYTLRDAGGKILAADTHLLSLRDLNTSDIVPDMIKAGVSSFKIEGRLKEEAYVKNVTAAYRQEIDRVIESNPEKYVRSSFGKSYVDFSPKLDKSFNRGFTHYFLSSRRPDSIYSPSTPKSLGEPINDIKMLNNGDGISFFDKDGRYTGAMVNGVHGSVIETSSNVRIPKNAEIHRTFDRIWDKRLQRPTAKRKISIGFSLDEAGLTASDERGCMVRIPYSGVMDVAKSEMNYKGIFEKLGNTPYRLESFKSLLAPDVFLPAAALTSLRRAAVDALDKANATTYPFAYRRPERKGARYMTIALDFRDNVANSLARKFYMDHGVKEIQPAIETLSGAPSKGLRVMTTRHCVLRELGLCKKEIKNVSFAEPLSITSGKQTFMLEFNCKDCEMHLLTT